MTQKSECKQRGVELPVKKGKLRTGVAEDEPLGGKASRELTPRNHARRDRSQERAARKRGFRLAAMVRGEVN